VKILVISEALTWRNGDHDPFKFRYGTLINALEERGHTISHLEFDRDKNQQEKAIFRRDNSHHSTITFRPNDLSKIGTLKRNLLEVLAPHRPLPHDEFTSEVVTSENPDLVISFLSASPRLIRNTARLRPTIHFAEENFLLSGPGAISPNKFGRLRELVARPFVRRVLPRAQNIVVISEAERPWANYFYPASDVHVIPLFLDEQRWLARVAQSTPPSIDLIEIFGIGNFLQLRNALGLKQFLEEMRLQSAGPIPKVTLASRSGLHKILRNVDKEQLHFLGDVEDPTLYYQQAKACIVPAFNVSGSKNQILQGWAMGCPVIATAPAAKSVGGIHAKDLMIGAQPKELVDVTLAVLKDEGLRTQLSIQGRESLLARFSTQAAVDYFVGLVEQNKS
jgi:glycosyltransferase involved in cell wall biosynthesis